MINFKLTLFCCLGFLASGSIALQSCGSKRNSTTDDSEPLSLNYNTTAVEIRANPSVLTLESYGLSSYSPQDSSVYAYNYKEHSIDIMSLAKDSVMRSIKLSPEGPDAIMPELLGLHVVSPDTILAYDYMAVNMLDDTGRRIDRIEFPDYGIRRLDCNSRSNIADFKMDLGSHILYYPVINDGRNEIVEYDYVKRSILKKYEMKQPNGQGKNYGFMGFPNVSYNGDLAIYNYPFENLVYILNLKDDTTRTITPSGTFADAVMEEYNESTPENIGWYGAENFFHSPLYYLPDAECYIRLTLGATTYDRSKNIDEAYYDRPFYLMIFDKEFKVMGEARLEDHKYNPFCGWFLLPGNIAFFQDNILNPNKNEDIKIDILTMD